MTELEYLKGKLADTEAEIERAERKADMDNLAKYVHDLYQSFVDAGFSEEQAWWFTGTLFQNELCK
jgi:hypothetical protein